MADRSGAPPSLCLSMVGVDPPHSSLQEPDRIAVINAPDVPRFVYDASRRAQGVDPDGTSVGGERWVRDLRDSGSAWSTNGRTKGSPWHR